MGVRVDAFAVSIFLAVVVVGVVLLGGGGIWYVMVVGVCVAVFFYLGWETESIHLVFGVCLCASFIVLHPLQF